MDILSNVLQAILGLGFVLFGLMKFGAKQMVDEFTRYGLPQWFRVVTGLLEITAAGLLVFGIWQKEYAVLGSAMVVMIMLGALMTHIKMKDPFKNMFMPILLLVLGAAVLIIQW